MDCGFEKLVIYQKSLIGVKLVFDLTANPPLTSQFSLKDQIQRASMSVSANIAEGSGRIAQKDYYHFISIALGSCNEVQAFLDIIKTLYPKVDVNKEHLYYFELSKQIFAFRKTLIKNY